MLFGADGNAMNVAPNHASMYNEFQGANALQQNPTALQGVVNTINAETGATPPAPPTPVPSQP